MRRFYPRVRVGRDQSLTDKAASIFLFLSARPRGTRLFFKYLFRIASLFLSARPRGTRLDEGSPDGDCTVFLSARPRGTRHADWELFLGEYAVSIRASAWDATHNLFGSKRLRGVSIRASAWDATFTGDHGAAFGCVSIRASAWDATRSAVMLRSKGSVSIRASAWDATFGLNFNNFTGNSFYPRVRVGRDGFFQN